MKSFDEKVLKVAKEIAVKFIEVGSLSPGAFEDAFKRIYRSVKEAVIEHSVEEETEEKGNSS